MGLISTKMNKEAGLSNLCRRHLCKRTVLRLKISGMGVRGDSYGGRVLQTLSTFAYGPEKGSAISVHLTAGGRRFGYFPEGLRLLVHSMAVPKLAAHSLRM